jgi:hypothetical protein
MGATPLSTPRMSATDSIGPAFNRAFLLLFRPLRMGSFLKQSMLAGLAETSYFAMMLGVPLPIIQFLVIAQMAKHGGTADSNSNFHSQVFAEAFVAIFGVIGSCVFTVLLYFICRKRFVILDLVLFRQGQIGEAWRKYGASTWRYFGLTLLLSLGVLLLVAIIAGPLVPMSLKMMQGMDPSKPEVGKMFSVMIPYMSVMMALGVLITALDGTVRDLFLPPMGLSNASIEDSFHRFFQLVRTEPGETALYILLRTVLGWVFQMAAVTIIMIPMLLLVALGVAGGMIVHHVAQQAGPAGQLFFVAYVVAALLILFVLYMIGILVALGMGGFFKQSYAVMWLSSRYPEITSVFYPAPPAPPVMPPPPSSTEVPIPPPDIAPPMLG